MTRLPALSALALLAALLALPGCRSTPVNGDPFLNGESEEVHITIDNQNFADATIYAHWESGARIRIGRVVGNTSETFEIEWRGGDLRIEANFLAGGDFISERISVARGDRLEYVLRPTGY